jgi:hypothetical protein
MSTGMYIDTGQNKVHIITFAVDTQYQISVCVSCVLMYMLIQSKLKFTGQILV